MKTLTAKETQALLDKTKKPIVINVLDRQHYKEAHIPGSENVPLSEANFVSQVEKLVPDKGQLLIVYCASQQCEASTKAAKKLDEAGFKNVYDFKGGMEEWKEALLPVNTLSTGWTFAPVDAPHRSTPLI